jgi:hypothetical protein
MVLSWANPQPPAPSGLTGYGDVPNDQSIDRTQGYIPTTVLWYCPGLTVDGAGNLGVTSALPASVPGGDMPPHDAGPDIRAPCPQGGPERPPSI